MPDKVVTRFAPSPTGYLHIGGARTALFCWLYARHTGGKFLLRIEDTDKERSTQAAIDAIHDGLSWLGLAGDEPALLQSARADRHREIALELVKRGAAYRCPVTAEELATRRTRAEELKSQLDASPDMPPQQRTQKQAEREDLMRPFRSPWRDPTKPLPEGKPTVVRLRMPDSGDLVVEDKVQGRVKVAAKDLDDLVLLRSDGNPTYMLAVVVDDHDMGVTHVIRGDDHLNNTFRQAPIFQGMGWPVPTYAHVPLIHGPDGKKLSKRHGATGVDAYRDELSYLPEGLKNYLLRLGWSHGDDEIIPEDKAIEWFDLDGLNKAPARLDFKKLDSINAHYMALADDDRLYKLFLARPEAQKLSDSVKARIRAAMPALKIRSANLVALADQARFLGEIRPVALAGKAADLVNAEAKERLAALVKRWEALPDWSEAALKEDLAQFAAQNGIGLGKIGPVLRAVLTGGGPAPDIALVLALLGRNESLARIKDYAAGG
jgi:glutamyl-tRNA synthetase